MAESVDAADLKSAGRKAVGVQVPLPPSLRSHAARLISMPERLRHSCLAVLCFWLGTPYDTVAVRFLGPSVTRAQRAPEGLCWTEGIEDSSSSVRTTRNGGRWPAATRKLDPRRMDLRTFSEPSQRVEIGQSGRKICSMGINIKTPKVHAMA